jgi:uncharacterized protein (TIGR00369 family)
MNDLPADRLDALRAFSRTAPFNVLFGIEIVRASVGEVELSMPWRAEAAQYAGYLHAGLIGALIDTACGCAAGTVAGRVLASHYSVNCLRPAVGERFIARARVVKAGRTQVFTAADLFAVSGTQETLVANGETMLSVAVAQPE